MISETTLPYEGKTFQSFFKDECLLPFDLSRLKQGEISQSITKQIIHSLNTTNRIEGIHFDVHKMEPELKGGICSTLAFEVGKVAVQLFENDKHANPQKFIDQLKTYITDQFIDATKKKGDHRHEKRIYLRSIQEALNTITVDPHAKIQDVGQSKIKALASFFELKVRQSTDEIDLATLSSETQFREICEKLENGVYLLRIIQAADNHKFEIQGHSVTYIKHSKGTELYFDNQLGLFNLSNSKQTTKKNLLFSAMQSANQLFYVSNFRFHRLGMQEKEPIAENSPLPAELNLVNSDPIVALGIKFQKLVDGLSITLESKIDISSLDSLVKYAHQIAFHPEASEIFRKRPEIATLLFDIALISEDLGDKKRGDEIRKKTLQSINAFTETQMKEKRYMSFLTPPLTGKYKVGVCRYYLEDESRCEKALGHPSNKSRRLEIDIHYPATESKDSEPKYKVLLLKNGIQEVFNSNFCTRSQPQQPPFKDLQFPLIVVSHGLGSSPDDLQHYIEEMVSHGYCVVAINHAYSNVLTRHMGHSQPVKELKTEDDILHEALIKAEDIKFVIEQIQKQKIPELHDFLGNILSTKSIGIMGYSLGGSAALLTAEMLPDISAIINIDGRPIVNEKTKKLLQPCLLIAGDEKKTDAFEKACDILSQTSPLFERINLSNTSHGAFTLATAYRTSPPMRLSNRLLQVQKQTMDHTLAFFNKHLKKSSLNSKENNS